LSKQAFGAARNLLQLLKGDHAKLLSGEDRSRRVQVIDAPHMLNQFGRGQHPSATQPAQPIGLGQAIGDDETLAINMEGACRAIFK